MSVSKGKEVVIGKAVEPYSKYINSDAEAADQLNRLRRRLDELQSQLARTRHEEAWGERQRLKQEYENTLVYRDGTIRWRKLWYEVASDDNLQILIAERDPLASDARKYLEMKSRALIDEPYGKEMWPQIDELQHSLRIQLMSQIHPEQLFVKRPKQILQYKSR